MLKRLMIFLVLCATTLSAKSFADDVVVIAPTASVADCMGASIGGINSGTVTYKAKYEPKQYKIKYTCGNPVSNSTEVGRTENNSSETEFETQSVTYDSPWLLLTRPGNCSFDGYEFAGWHCDYDIATGVNDNGTDTNKPNYPYASGAITDGKGTEYKVDDDVMCVAAWKKRAHTVTYKPGDHGSGADYEDNAGNYGQNYTVKPLGITGITPDMGYHFDVWKGNKFDGTSGLQTYAENTTVTYNLATGNVLTAQWLKNNGTLTYSCGSVGGTPKQQTSVEITTDMRNFKFMSNLEGCEVDGHTFTGWKCEYNIETGTKTDTLYYYDDDSGKFRVKEGETSYRFAPNTVVVPEQDATIECVAQWDTNYYTVTYKPGDHGTGDSAVFDVEFDYRHMLHNNIEKDDTTGEYIINIKPEPGYEFDVWKCDIPKTDVVREYYSNWRPGEKFQMPGKNVVCDAIWKPISYYLKYELYIESSDGTLALVTNVANGVSPLPPSGLQTYTVEDLITPVIPARNGYVFGGWYVPGENGTLVNTSINGAVYIGYTASNPLVIYGKLTENVYNITYMACVNGDCDNGVNLTGYLSDEYKTFTRDNIVSFPTSVGMFDSVLQNRYRFVYDKNSNIKWFNMYNQDSMINTDGVKSDITVWTKVEKLYRVDYTCGEGSGDAPEGKSYAPEAKVVLSENKTCEKTNEMFTGWDCGVEGLDENQVPNTAFIMPKNDVRCVAHYEGKGYLIEYDCMIDGKPTKPFVNGGKHAPNSRPTLGKYEVLCGNNPNYTFVKWVCHNNATGQPVENEDNEILMPENNVLCTAELDNNSYNIVYHYVGDVGATWANGQNHPLTYDYGTTTNIGIPSRENYRFVGWCVGDENCNSYANNVNGYTISNTQSGTVHLYAKWDPIKYTITYKLRIKKSGESLRDVLSTDAVVQPSPANITEYDATTAQTILNNPSKDSYTFGGWYTDENETSANKVTVVPLTGVFENLTLYGTLTEKAYNITYMACVNGDCDNGVNLTGYLPDEYKTFTRDNIVSFPTSVGVFNRNVLDEYSFVYKGNNDIQWFNMYNQDSMINTDGVKSGITVWTKVATLHDLTYICGDGATGVAPDAEKYVYGDVATVLSNKTCAKTGYYFDGWVCDGVHKNVGNTVNMLADVICVADWEPNGHAVTYRPGNHGSFESGYTSVAVAVDYGEEHKLLKPSDAHMVANTGYEFDNWDCRYSDTDMIDIDPGYILTMPDADVVCDADWKPKHYDVLYNKGDHAADNVNNYVDTYDEDTETGGAEYNVNYVALTGGTRESETGVYAVDGYTFNGWSKSAHQTVGDWTGETPWQIDDDLTVYAAYEPNLYQISYDCNMDNVLPNVSSQDIYFDADYMLANSDNCVAPGHDFVGWYCPGLTGTPTVSNGNELVWFAAQSSDVYAVSGNTTCYAQWKVAAYNIIYKCGSDADENSVSPKDNSPHYYNEDATILGNVRNVDGIELVACRHKNYNFSGWTCDGEDVLRNVGDTLNITGDVECKANWIKMCCSAPGEYLDTDDGVCAMCPEHSHPVSGDCPETCECDTGYKLENGTCVEEVYTITYIHGEGGGFKPNAKYLEEYTVNTEDTEIPDSVRPGYVFHGWNLVNNDDGSFASADRPIVPGDYFRANPEDLTLVAQWIPGGEIRYYCSKEDEENNIYDSIEGGVGKRVITGYADTCDCVALNECVFKKWRCQDGDYDASSDFIEHYITVGEPDNDGVSNRCYADLEFDIEYHVYTVDEDETVSELSSVKIDGRDTLVENIKPDKVTSRGESVYYPNVVFDEYTFDGWYEVFRNGEFYNWTEKTPEYPTGKIVVYGKMVKKCPSGVYLHINDEKMCLYDTRPDNSPYLVIQKGGKKYYGIMTKQTDKSDLPITNDSGKKMHIEYKGKTYNVHDKSAR